MDDIRKRDIPIYNVIALFLTSILGFFLIGYGKASENAGMARIVIVWIPLIISLITIALYYISRIFTKRNNWIITVFGVLLQLTIAIQAFWDL